MKNRSNKSTRIGEQEQHVEIIKTLKNWPSKADAAVSHVITRHLPTVKESRIWTIHKIGRLLKRIKIMSNGQILKSAHTKKNPLKDVISTNSGNSLVRKT